MTKAVGARASVIRRQRLPGMSSAKAVAVALCAVALLSSNAAAQGTSAPAASFPAKPVRFILPVAAGSTSDTLARLVAQALTLRPDVRSRTHRLRQDTRDTNRIFRLRSVP